MLQMAGWKWKVEKGLRKKKYKENSKMFVGRNIDLTNRPEEIVRNEKFQTINSFTDRIRKRRFS